jgi:hypothetical protein
MFAFTQKFFGEGTFLSQNVARSKDLLGSQFNFNDINEENLFTETHTAARFSSARRLSEFYRKRRFTQFSRVGASYQFSTVERKDPEVNADPNNPSQFIPVIYKQPNILTSRGTLSLLTTRATRASIRPRVENFSRDCACRSRRRRRTYQPTLSYTQFFPMRRKKSEHPEVLASASSPERSAALRPRESERRKLAGVR